MKKHRPVIYFLTVATILTAASPLSAKIYEYEWLNLGVTADMATSRSLTWRTDADKPEAVAQIAPMTVSPDIEKDATEVKVRSALETDYGVSKYYHKVLFEGLRPATEYLYRVGDGKGAWSEWFEFSTSAGDNREFSFIYLGDVQEGMMDQFPRMIRKAYGDCPDATFVIYDGDLTNNATDEEFGELFRANGWILSKIAAAPVADSHECRERDEHKNRLMNTQWEHMFTYPQTDDRELSFKGNYSFDCQGCRFIIVNTTMMVGSEEYAGRVTEWIRSLLSDNPCKWTVVVQHWPLLSVNYGRGPARTMNRLKYAEMYEEYGVDLILSGHDHVYGRRATTRNGRKTTPVHVISNVGGKSYPPGFNPAFDRMGSDIQLYQVITVSDKEITYISKDAAGEVYDAFSIKSKGSRKIFRDMSPERPERLEVPEHLRTYMDGKFGKDEWDVMLGKKKAYESRINR